jgi:glycosyltransferase involved in cell wall biosynthesis
MSRRKQLMAALSRRLLPRANWHVLHFLDPITFDIIENAYPEDANRFRLMPDPVEHVSQIAPVEARRRLELPTDGRLVGCVGVLTERKGVDLLLKAFRRAKLGEGDRLLLAGPMNDVVRGQVESECGELLRSGRVLTIDRPLGVDEVMLAVMACDLVSVPNPHQLGSSSLVIRSAAAQRPVLASDFGWMRWAMSRFALGWLVNVRDTEAFARGLRVGLDEAAEMKQLPSAKRFVQFHGAGNFKAHWTARLRERLRLTRDERYLPWQWVMEESPAGKDGG